MLELACSPLHAYFAVLAVSGLALLAVCTAGHDVRRRAALLAKALPFHGRGAAFVGVTSVMQLAFVAITIALEGDPLASGSLLSAIVASVVTALLGAWTLQAIRARIETIERATTRIVRFGSHELRLRNTPAASGPYFAFVAIRGNRPPPRTFPTH
jgi:tetrahydromethanopterin S-methyltransferase subunit C